MASLPLDPSQDAFTLLQHGHRDMVVATAFNLYGDRFASSSVDGKIKVYNRHRDGTWNLCDTWGAHNAEILQIQWLPPSIHPNLLASVSTDGKFRIWVEDPTIAPNRGRRFAPSSRTPVFELRAPSRAPFLSFAIKHHPATRHTYLALVKRNAELTVYENEEPEQLDNWSEMDVVRVCERPARGEEMSFKVAFDPNVEVCYNAIRQGVARDALGVVVAGMGGATVWRTKEISHNVSLGSTTSKEFYLAAELKGHRGLVRDVAWAPGSIRGFDVVATACKDGFVRVFEVATPGNGVKTRRSKDYARVLVQEQAVVKASEGTPSGIGAGLASARRQQDGDGEQGKVYHVAKEVAKLDSNRTPVWKVEFDEDGQLLGSTGDDGKLMLYRREPTGVWSRSAELALSSG